MTTFAKPDVERRLAELDERTRVAWMSYRDALRDLGGLTYDDAEATAWDELQATLRELAISRSELALPSSDV